MAAPTGREGANVPLDPFCAEAHKAMERHVPPSWPMGLLFLGNVFWILTIITLTQISKIKNVKTVRSDQSRGSGRRAATQIRVAKNGRNAVYG